MCNRSNKVKIVRWKTAALKVLLGLALTLPSFFAGSVTGVLAQDDGVKRQPEPPAPAKHKDAYAQEYAHSFKTDRELGPEFHWHGLDPQGCVTFEPAGLRISLPEGHPGKRMGTGIGMNTTVQGDFEITLRYQFIKEPNPADAGLGTGMFIWVDLAKPSLNRGFISRVARPAKKFVVWYHLTPDGAAKPVDVLRTYPAKEASGRLRLVRTGATLFHYAADGEDAEFTLLQEHPFGAADLQAIRWGGQTGGERATLDGRFLDLRIRADGLPELRANPAAPPVQGDDVAATSNPTRGWLAAAVLGGVVVMLGSALLVGLIQYMRKKLPNTAAVATQKQPSAAEEASLVVFACPKCGERVKARANLAGKKVKCPHCGDAAHVPAVEASI